MVRFKTDVYSIFSLHPSALISIVFSSTRQFRYRLAAKKQQLPRFDSLSRRIAVLEPTKDPEASDDPSGDDTRSVGDKSGPGDEEDPAATNNADGGEGNPATDGDGSVTSQSQSRAGGGDGRKSDTGDSADAAVVGAAVADAEREQPPRPVVGDTAVKPEKAGGGEEEERGGEGAPAAVGGGGGGAGDEQREEEEEEERLRREEELGQLSTEREGVALELLYCTELHNVFQDYNADDGMTPDAEGFADDDGVDAGEGASPGSEGGGSGEVAPTETSAAAAGGTAAGSGTGEGDGISASN